MISKRGVVTAGLLAVFAIIGGTVLTWTRDPDIRYFDVPNDTMTVGPDRNITFERLYCAKGEHSAYVKRWLSPPVVDLDHYVTKVANGCHRRRVTLHVPDALGPGRYTLETATFVKASPIRTTRYNMQPIHFSIAAPDGSIPAANAAKGPWLSHSEEAPLGGE